MRNRTRNVLMFVALAVGALVVIGALAYLVRFGIWGTGVPVRGMVRPYGMYRPWFGLVGFVPMLFFWGLLIGGIVLLFRAFGHGPTQISAQAPTGESVTDILNRRYASGEITKEQYDQMKKDLS